MQRFTDAILKSLETGNWYGALFMSLTMPDICARLASENDKTNGRKYAGWFDSNVVGKYTRLVGTKREKIVFMDGDACYALRCAMLHQGEADLSKQSVKSVVTSMHFTTTSDHCNRINGVLQLNVDTFCRDICSSVEEWYSSFKLQDGSQDKIDSLLTVYDYGNTILD
ncbi:hypothetical protein [Pseudomonas sp. fls2-241-R2A-110]|uniref:hypothetical protein n=1 Tax=Pseudomonas sp. fls2-241-R2A-110 TaxID=3040311 RepID=UPI002555E843|nr:hypothetical protein [Pseudomonas sp. fls2-241-R2A-110]